MPNEKDPKQNKAKKGFFFKIFGGSKNSCCDVKIVPKEEADQLQKDAQLATHDSKKNES
tara:strand:+ start:335 stop:511 length:177 start_codon:yes stop_codon:yes gene_type:complete